MEEAGTIVTTRVTQVPMSALLLSRVMSRNRIRTSPNVVGVMAMVSAEEPMEANKAADT